MYPEIEIFRNAVFAHFDWLDIPKVFLVLFGVSVWASLTN